MPQASLRRQPSVCQVDGADLCRPARTDTFRDGTIGTKLTVATVFLRKSRTTVAAAGITDVTGDKLSTVRPTVKYAGAITLALTGAAGTKTMTLIDILQKAITTTDTDTTITQTLARQLRRVLTLMRTRRSQLPRQTSQNTKTVALTTRMNTTMRTQTRPKTRRSSLNSCLTRTRLSTFSSKLCAC